VDIVFRDLTKPNSFFDVLIWGMESRFSADYAKGAWYVKTDYKGAQREDSEGRSRYSARCVDDDCAGRKGRDRRLQHCGQQDLCEAAARCEDGNDGLHAGRQTAGTVEYDGIGFVHRLWEAAQIVTAFTAFESFIAPPTIYRLDTLTGKREVFAQPKVPFDTSQYELKQVFYHIEGRHARADVHRGQRRD
jgi:prolyl oligopeptidase